MDPDIKGCLLLHVLEVYPRVSVLKEKYSNFEVIRCLQWCPHLYLETRLGGLRHQVGQHQVTHRTIGTLQGDVLGSLRKIIMMRSYLQKSS